MIFCDINTFLSPRGGGIRTYHAHKAQWFAARGEDRYLTVEPAAGRGERPGPSINVRHLQFPAPLFSGKNYRFLVSYDAIGRMVREQRVDVLEAGDPWLTARFVLGGRVAGDAGRTAASHEQAGALAPLPVRTSFWHSDPETAYLDRWSAHRPLRWLLRPVARAVGEWVHRQQARFDLVWCASQWVGKLLASRGVTNVETLPFGLDHSLFSGTPRDEDFLRSLGLDPARPILLYAGRLDPEKGVDVLLAALPDLLALPGRPQVVVAGRGALADGFRRNDIDGYRFLGFFEDRQDIARLLASSSLLLATCSVETFGLAVLESLAAGLPVVSADSGGGAELVSESGAGALFRAGDRDSLVRTVAQMLPRAAVLRGPAAEFAARWPSWDDMFRRQHERCLEIHARKAQIPRLAA